MSVDRQSYLITGATGFIGLKLLNVIKSAGHKVRILSRTQHADYETVVCNLGQEQIPLSSLESVDTIFHLAGFAHDLRDASQLEEHYRKVNVDATVELANLAAKSGVKKFIYVSSVKAGGSSIAGRCITEDDKYEPDGVYGKTKREAELKLLEIGRQSNIFISILRPSLVYGAGVKGNLRMMLSGVEKGWFPPLPETGNLRSMIHVDDLIQALLLVASREAANGEVYIATDGKTYSSREIYETMCHALGKPIPRWHVPRFLFDFGAFISPLIRYKVEKLLGDEHYSAGKLQSLGFKPQHTLSSINR